MRKFVKKVKMQDMKLVLEGIGSLGVELPLANKAAVKVVMYIDDEVPGLLFAEIGRHSCAIPLANCQILILDEKDWS